MSPLPYNDTGLYERDLPVQIVLWLLTAASSGILGNLAYVLREAITSAAAHSRQFLSALKRREEGHDNLPPRTLRRQGGLVVPDQKLRDALVEIANDALARSDQLTGTQDGPEPWSEVNVYLTQRETWFVLVRKAGAERSVGVEMDLAAEDEGFPVTLWL